MVGIQKMKNSDSCYGNTLQNKRLFHSRLKGLENTKVIWAKGAFNDLQAPKPWKMDMMKIKIYCIEILRISWWQQMTSSTKGQWHLTIIN